jgi:hypothetical protein
VQPEKEVNLLKKAKAIPELVRTMRDISKMLSGGAPYTKSWLPSNDLEGTPVTRQWQPDQNMM